REWGVVAHAAGAPGVMHRLIQTLSKGYRRGVGVPQPLLGTPPVLILDEPTEGLDPSQRAEVRQLIKGLAGQHTVILSTHILSEVTMTCKRVLILNQGKMVAFDEIQNLAHALGQGDQTSLEDIFLKLTAAA